MKDPSPLMTTMTTMTTLAPPTHELERQLRTLSLSGMAQTLLARNQEAISHHLAYTEFLELLVADEFARRRDRLFTRRLKTARVPQLKTLESFDWSFNPQIPKALILDLGTVRFIPEHGGLLLLGPPGTGKSHIALSLTVAAIQAGYTAYYRSAFDLAQDLAEADATGTRPELIKKLTRVDLLVIEDLGMRHMPPTAAEDLLEIFTRRYETGYATGSRLASATTSTAPYWTAWGQRTRSTGRAPAWTGPPSRQKGGRCGPGGRPESDRPRQGRLQAPHPGRPPGHPAGGLAHGGQRPRLGCLRRPDQGRRADQAATRAPACATRQAACR
jgi:DNA replication protein DnaC